MGTGSPVGHCHRSSCGVALAGSASAAHRATTAVKMSDAAATRTRDDLCKSMTTASEIQAFPSSCFETPVDKKAADMRLWITSGRHVSPSGIPGLAEGNQ